jgi:hypothetical protein
MSSFCFPQLNLLLEVLARETRQEVLTCILRLLRSFSSFAEKKLIFEAVLAPSHKIRTADTSAAGSLLHALIVDNVVKVDRSVAIDHLLLQLACLGSRDAAHALIRVYASLDDGSCLQSVLKLLFSVQSC